MLLALWLACGGGEDPPGYTFVGVDEGPGLRGPGGPAATFTEDQLWQSCASLTGGDEDVLHHNLVMPYRGHLVLPWAPEFGGGGLAFFDVSDPCAPERVGTAFSPYMRETHAIGFLHLPDGEQAGDYAVVTGNLGVQIWDITDPTAPEVLSYTQLEGVFYPDAYARVVLSVFWQHPHLYVAAADNGVFVLDTSDLSAPELLSQYSWEPTLRAGGVFALGNLLMVSSAEQSRVALMDISIPDAPMPIPGGDFQITDATGEPTEAYHANLTGPWGLFARKEGGGGVIVYDLSDPSAPTYAGEGFTPGGNGGYVFYDEGYAFVGDSHWAKVFDLRDLDDITEVGTGTLAGDLDTAVPYGNVVVMSVDDDAEDGVASAILPWQAAPDSTGPTLLAVDPPDGAGGVAPTARVGLGFDEPIEPGSAFAGSVRLWDAAGLPVEGWVTTQETLVTYHPKAPLAPGATYTVEVLAGGVADLNNNPTAATVTTTFTTAGGP